MIDITIKTLENQNQAFSVDDEITVAQLKETIRDEMNIGIEFQRLIFGGKVLTDDMKLSEQGVDGKVIHLVPSPPPSTLSRQGTAQRQQAEAAENANRATSNRPVDSPVPRVTFDPPSDAVLEQRHQASLTNVSGRTDFIGTAIDEARNSMDYLDYYSALSASTNVPVVHAEDCDSDSMDILHDLPEVSFVTKNTSHNTEPQPSTSAVELQPSTSAQPAEVMRSQTQALGASTNVPVVHAEDCDSASMDILHDLPEVPFVTKNTSRNTEPQPSTSAIEPQPSTSAQPAEVMRSQTQSETNTVPPVPYRRGPRPPTRPILLTPADLAKLFEELSELHARFEPHRAAYCALLRDRSTALDLPSLEVTRRQAYIEMVGDVLHSFAHIYHALSDIDLNIGDYSTKLTTDPVPEPNNSFQVQASVPVRRNNMLLQNFMANMQNALHRATNQQASQSDGSQGQNRATNPGQTGPNQGPTGLNQEQTGQAQGDGNRPRVFMEIENLVRTLSQAHPGVDVVMSMEEVQPVGSLNMGPPDIFPSDPQNESFLFDINAAIPVIETNNPNLSGSPTGGNEGGPNTGIRFISPGVGGTPRFNLPGFAATLGYPDGSSGSAGVGFSTSGPSGVGFSTIGPTRFQLQPDGEVFVSPMGTASSRSDIMQEMINTVLRQNSSSTTTPGTNTTANTTSANQNNVNVSTNSTNAANAAPIPNAMYTINPNVATPLTFHSHVTYRIAPDFAVVHHLNVGDAVPVGERSASAGASRRTTNERRRTNREINRSPHLQSLNNLSNVRAHHRALEMMLYDRYLMCNNVYAYERLTERRYAYQEQQSEQMQQRLLRSSPTGIERLENFNNNFTTRHMACMMRLLSGPISPESRLNAFMVAVARQLYLDPPTLACSQHPPIAPLEFYFVRMHLRDYLQRIVNTVIDAGGRENLFDQTAAIILGQSRTFINQMDQCTLLSTAAPPVHMLRMCLRFHIPELLACILSDVTSEPFVETFYSVIERFYTDICAYTMSFCVNGFEGFRHLYSMYIEYLTENFEDSSREWVRLVSRENLLAIQSRIDPMTPANFVYQGTRAQRQTSPQATLPPPPAPNATPETAESLPSVSSISNCPPRRDNNFFDIFSPPTSPEQAETTLRSLAAASDEYRSSPESGRELKSVIFPDSPPLSAPEISRPTPSQEVIDLLTDKPESPMPTPLEEVIDLLTENPESGSAGQAATPMPTPSQDVIDLLIENSESGSAGQAGTPPISQEIIWISDEMTDASQLTQATEVPRTATNTSDSLDTPVTENLAACSNSGVVQVTGPVRLRRLLSMRRRPDQYTRAPRN